MIYQIPILNTQLPAIVIPAEKPKPPVTYVIKDGDTLTSIAQSQNTTVSRLFDKNISIANPDAINPGETLTVPQTDEALAGRPYPATINPATSPVSQVSPPNEGFSVGNSYDYHSCTWYAKEKRPDLPNNLGNASTWVARARTQGISTGSVPKEGAIGQQGNHVVYIERVNDDDTVYLSERNYDWNGSFRYRTAQASDFEYIY